jgi:putative zinc finger/helix-turn-helix YgiT family protein
MIKCHLCGTAMESRRENHRYTQSGLSNVTIVDLEVRHCPNCGEREYVFPKIAQLHRLLAFQTAKQPVALVGEQIRFLRKYLGWSREQFASIMGVEGETISRWENDKAKMGKAADRLLRVLVFTKAPVQEYDPSELADVGKPGKPTMMRVAANSAGWAAAEPAVAA